MTTPARKLLRRSLAAAALLAASCAHAPTSRTDRAVAAAEPAQEEWFVTGSHIPRRIDDRGIPPTSSPARVYSREDVTRTGSQDLGRALHRLDPSL
jgi:hypothetical protein